MEPMSTTIALVFLMFAAIGAVVIKVAALVFIAVLGALMVAGGWMIYRFMRTFFKDKD